mmetsp:Transcript_52034/g.121946  ORF Transcript_52034/g.121946 Transcript_52034/m.121946 type:complete len:247 (-) Transcript_52034:487-1227(-)
MQWTRRARHGILQECIPPLLPPFLSPLLPPQLAPAEWSVCVECIAGDVDCGGGHRGRCESGGHGPPCGRLSRGALPRHRGHGTRPHQHLPDTPSMAGRRRAAGAVGRAGAVAVGAGGGVWVVCDGAVYSLVGRRHCHMRCIRALPAGHGPAVSHPRRHWTWSPLWPPLHRLGQDQDELCPASRRLPPTPSRGVRQPADPPSGERHHPGDQDDDGLWVFRGWYPARHLLRRTLTPRHRHLCLCQPSR